MAASEIGDDEEKTCEEKVQAPVTIRLDLDTGKQRYRTRTQWWKIWLPRNPPPPTATSLADAKVSPVVEASLLAQLTYSWITPILVLGFQRTLQVPDLWKVHPTQEAGYLSDKLEAAWTRRCEEADAWNARLEAGEIHPSVLRKIGWAVRSLAGGTHCKDRYASLYTTWRNVDGRKEPSLPWALNEVMGFSFWMGGCYKVLGDTSQMCGPLLIRAIIDFAKHRATARIEGTEPPHIGRGIGMAIGMFILTIMSSIFQHQFFWRSMTVGSLTRATLISSIYKRGVMLSGESRATYTNAALVNHISTDVSRIDAAAQWFHAGWTAPIQVLVCLIILLVQLGPSVLAGFALFVIIIPIQERIMSRRFTIRKKSMKFTDKRAKTLFEVLNNMRIVKYFSYEMPFLKRIFDLRKNELKGLKEMHHTESLNTSFAFSIPVLASTVAFAAYTSVTPGFDAAIIFSSMSLFQLLRQPMMFLPRSMSGTADGISAFRRLSGLFRAPVLASNPFTIDPTLDVALTMKKVSYEWEVTAASREEKDGAKPKGEKTEDAFASDDTIQEAPFRVRDVTLEVPRGCLAALVGRVGSGKSSLLQGLIGEMRLVQGSFAFGGRVAYCAQSAWIQNATLKDNILFGKTYKEERYWSAVERACLLPDLETLPDGDLTEIGEKGINLSGGQKQRVNIARALYNDADVLLFDDPLSAVDAHVGNRLFHDAILPLARQGKTVILVTHALHFLSHCDYIYTIDNGSIVEQGPYQQLIDNVGDFARLAKEFGGLSGSSDSQKKTNDGADDGIAIEDAKAKSARIGAGTGKLEGRLIVKESRTTGSVPLVVYKSYLSAARAWITIPLALLAMILMQGSQILSTYTLVWWQENLFDRPFSFYQGLYAGLGIAQTVFTTAVGLCVDLISDLVSRNLHNDAVHHVFHATMAFFDTTPTGRIMGIFGKDIDSIDNQLPTSMRMLAIIITQLIGSIVIITVFEYYFIIAAVVVAFGFAYFSTFYRSGAREIKRLDSMMRSLTYAHFAESLSGLATIRSYGEIHRFIEENKFYIDLENRAGLLVVTTQRWLSIRLDALGSVLVFCVAILAVVGISGISPAQIGLVLTYSTTLTQLSSAVTRQTAEVENYMNAVERVVNFSNGKGAKQEAPHVIEDARPPGAWPDRGSIAFSNVQMSYRPGLPKVLKGISMDIAGGEKIGIVGRTGAGKSSLILALLRIVEYEGSIEVDGLDIAKMGLMDLRKRMSLIPQDPTLFSGTVRTTLDPFSMYDDARLWGALQRSFLVPAGSSTTQSSAIDLYAQGQTKMSLDTVVDAEGANFSVGERSLLSLARALVKDSKIIILDEASASVDVETDAKIQQTIKTEFKDRTLLCIAHRLRTIIHYDRVLVLDSGNIAEFDTPAKLYKDNGIFTTLCEHSGITLGDIERAATL